MRDHAAELLPCPFCGGAANMERRGTSRQSMIVECESCGARVESGDVAGLTPPASWGWNRRHAPEIDRLRAENEALRSGLERLAQIYEGEQEPCERPAWLRDLLKPNAKVKGGRDERN